VTCIINGCGQKLVGKKCNIADHVDLIHRGVSGGIAAAGLSAYAAPVPAEEGLEEEEMTADSAAMEAADASAAMLFSLGMSTNAIEMIDGPLLDALLACRAMKSRRAILRKNDGSLDKVLKGKLMPYLKGLIAGEKVVISVDKKDQKMARGKSMINILINCTKLKAPILAACIVVPFNTVQDAAYYEKLVGAVITDFSIEKINIIGVSVDNTNVNPAFVNAMGLQLLPCVMHICHLMFDAVMQEFNMGDNYGFRMFFAHSHALRDKATQMGLSYRSTQTPGTRMAAAFPFIEELAQPGKFEMYAEFVRDNPPGAFVRDERKKAKVAGAVRGGCGRGRGFGRGRGGGRGSAAAAGGGARDAGGLEEAAKNEAALSYRVLLANMNDKFSKGAVLVSYALLKDLYPLLISTQANPRRIPFDFWVNWDAAATYRESWFNDTDVKVAELLAKNNTVLDDEGFARLVNATVRALEAMDNKVDSHLMEDGAGGLDEDGDPITIRKHIGIYRRREYWDITNRGSLPIATNAEAMFNSIGRHDDAFCRSYIKFLALFDAGRLGIDLPPRPRKHCTCTAHRDMHHHPEDNEGIVDFYLGCAQHLDVDVRAVGIEVSAVCSIQLSEAVVERSFAIVTNRQAANTLIAQDHYLMNLSMFSCNQTHLRDMFATPMSELSRKFFA
jgi:hypothetical protein